MPRSSQTPITAERLAEIKDLLKYESSIAFYSHRAKESMLLLVDEAEEAARLRFRLAELGEQGAGDHETVAEAAQMYRNLRPIIERTMAEPDRWDGDEDESFHLGRYVEWLAAERAQVRAEVLAEAIEAARSEYLHEDTGTPEDEAYNQAVSDVVAAIGALLEGGAS